MEVVVAWQWISRHVDARLATFEARVAEVADRLNLFTQPAKRNIQLNTPIPIINSEAAGEHATL